MQERIAALDEEIRDRDAELAGLLARRRFLQLLHTARNQARCERSIITVKCGGGSGTHVGTFGCTCDQSRAGFDCMGLGFDQRFLGTRTLFFCFFSGFSAGGGLAS